MAPLTLDRPQQVWPSTKQEIANMTDTQTKTTNRKPTHDIFHVRGEGKSAFWTKVGAGWIHEDTEGMNLALDLVPIDGSGRLVVRIRKEKPAQGSEQPQQIA